MLAATRVKELPLPIYNVVAFEDPPYVTLVTPVKVAIVIRFAVLLRNTQNIPAVVDPELAFDKVVKVAFDVML